MNTQRRNDEQNDREGHVQTAQTPSGREPDGIEPLTERPGDLLRSLPEEAKQRGSRFVSAQAMQARLFSVYDATASAERALTLVQAQLTLTLSRSYYDADEIEHMADELDKLLNLPTASPSQ
ncbi:MAG: hypothetical protein ACYCVN_06730 [Acidimicrobiales bacterium]